MSRRTGIITLIFAWSASLIAADPDTIARRASSGPAMDTSARRGSPDADNDRAKTPEELGKMALERRSFNPPFWGRAAYDNLWKTWPNAGKSKPKDFDQQVMKRYGLHAAPFANDDLPMGLRTTRFLLKKGLANDCMLCHGGSIFGKSYIGLGNASLDYQALYEDLSEADGLPKKSPFVFSNVRGTTEAGGMAVYLLSFRDDNLKLTRRKTDLGLRDDLCEDPPAWWLLKKKKTMYHTGGADARSVRSIMQFMMHPLNTPDVFEREEPIFRDVQKYILDIKPPKYPLPVDNRLAADGKKLFERHCASCHGTYGEKWTYPNKIVPIDKIGTDRRRFEGISKEFAERYNRSWFAKEQDGWLMNGYKVKTEAVGYQAPPLDGVWATAPYFHNGSVPTVYHVLNSKARPKVFTRSFGTDRADYDVDRLGWKFVETKPPRPGTSPLEGRKIYDTTRPGQGNQGHTYGDTLSEPERSAILEYLKSL